MTYEKACDLLAETGWLSRVDPAFRIAALEGSKLKEFDAGEYVYHVGDESDGLWGLADGALSLDVAAGDREPEMRLIRHPGTWHGEIGVVTRMGRIVALRATQPSTLLQLPMRRLKTMLEGNPGYWRWIALLSVEHTLLASQFAEDFMVRDTRQRIAVILLRLSGYLGMDGGRASAVTIAQDDLARICNLSRSVLSPILREFEQLGAIRRRYREIQVDRPKILLKIAECE